MYTNRKVIWSLCIFDIILIAENKGIDNPEEFVKDNLQSILAGIRSGLNCWADIVETAIDNCL